MCFESIASYNYMLTMAYFILDTLSMCLKTAWLVEIERERGEGGRSERTLQHFYHVISNEIYRVLYTLVIFLVIIYIFVVFFAYGWCLFASWRRDYECINLFLEDVFSLPRLHIQCMGCTKLNCWCYIMLYLKLRMRLWYIIHFDPYYGFLFLFLKS